MAGANSKIFCFYKADEKETGIKNYYFHAQNIIETSGSFIGFLIALESSFDQRER
jgi:hypothetical protein